MNWIAYKLIEIKALITWMKSCLAFECALPAMLFTLQTHAKGVTIASRDSDSIGCVHLVTFGKSMRYRVWV